MKKSNLIISTVLLTQLFFGCNKDESKDFDIPKIPENAKAGNYAFVLNEGGFNAGNSTVDRYNVKENKYETGVYNQVNVQALGDVANQFLVNQNKAYITVNNSAKIVEVNLPDLALVRTISGFNSPRQMFVWSTNKAYVTDLYQNAVYIVDLTNSKIVGQIKTMGHTDAMLKDGNNLLVTLNSSNKVLVINTQTNNIIDSIMVNQSPNSMVKDSDGNIWVLCDGGWTGNDVPALYKIKPLTYQLLQKFEMPAGTYPNNLTINAAGNELYYLNSGIYKLDKNAQQLPGNPIIQKPATGSFYGLGIEPNTGNIYVTNAADFSSPGTVQIYSSDYTLLNTFTTGVNPGKVAFFELK